MLLRIDKITKLYGDALVLNGVSFMLDEGRRLGLVGANGVGKTTLLKIIVGELQADSGVVDVGPYVDIGYLPQMLSTGQNRTGNQRAGITIREFVYHSLGSLHRIQDRLRKLEQAMATAPDDIEKVLAEYGRLAETFERRGGYDLEHRMHSIFAGLGIAAIAPERNLSTLSGGEKSRVGLATLLLRAPDLLLLDEPTNHLDFSALEWLESYLQDYRGGVLIVSHDRVFLNRTAHAIVEIVAHSRASKLYSGNYDFYAKVKREERIRWETDYWTQQTEIRELRRAIKSKARQVAHNRPPRDSDKFLTAFKDGRVNDAISRNVRNAEERLRRIESDPVPKPPNQLTINANFDPHAIFNHTPLVVSGVSKQFGTKQVLHHISFALDTATRATIVAPNGAGKSTLLRIIAGLEQPDTGSVEMAGSAVLGYLDQEQERLDEEGTAIEIYQRASGQDFERAKAELLSYGLFVYAELQLHVHVLSAGQKQKLQIAVLIAKRANVLLLDEPTNHISLNILEEFERALQEFPGPILAVSHDRRFIECFGGEVWTLDQGALIRFRSGWEEYRAAIDSQLIRNVEPQ